MARNEPWEGAGVSGILVSVTQPDAGGSPCAFPEKPVRFSKLLKRIYLTSLSHNWPVWSCGSVGPSSPAAPVRTPSPPPSRPLALSPWGNWNNLRQYLREWLYDGSDRTSPCQTRLDATLCFAPLLRWVLAWWRSGRLAPVSSTGQALAIDPTLEGDQTTAIVISVLYRSCAIPVAWRIHPATQRGSWMDPTVELLEELAPAVPHEMSVIVLCDRGISSPKLWQQICAQSLPPATTGGLAPRYALSEEHHLLRRRRQTIARPALPFPSRYRLGRSGRRLQHPQGQSRCTLMVSATSNRRNPGSSSPTCLQRKSASVGTPCASGSNWASKPALGHDRGAIKSLGWKWDKTRRTDPARISRHWLVLSVTTLLALAYGTRVEDAHDRRIAPGNLRTPPQTLASNHRDPRSRPARTVSVIRHGIDWLRRLLLKGRLWSRVWLLPEPGPEPKPNLAVTHHAPS